MLCCIFFEISQKFPLCHSKECHDLNLYHIFICCPLQKNHVVIMSAENGNSLEAPRGVICPQCNKDCRDNRELFSHVQRITRFGTPSCLVLLGKTPEEFKAEYKRKRFRDWVRHEVFPSFIYCFIHFLAVSPHQDDPRGFRGRGHEICTLVCFF